MSDSRDTYCTHTLTVACARMHTHKHTRFRVNTYAQWSHCNANWPAFEKRPPTPLFWENCQQYRLHRESWVALHTKPHDWFILICFNGVLTADPFGVRFVNFEVFSKEVRHSHLALQGQAVVLPCNTISQTQTFNKTEKIANGFQCKSVFRTPVEAQQKGNLLDGWQIQYSMTEP